MVNSATRRSFIECLACFAAGEAFAAPCGSFSGGSPELVFGATSDIHILHPNTGFKVGTAVWEKALNWYKEQGVDAVLVAGDLSEHGLTDELVMIGEAWQKVFPGNKGANGQNVEKVFVTGNHDFEAWKYKGGGAQKMYPNQADLEKHKIVGRYQEAWKEAFGEDYEPIYMKNIKGYRFVGSHWMEGGGRQWGRRLAEFTAAHKDELRGNKPFFYVQHPHLGNTVYPGFSRQVADDGKTADALKAFPNAVTFSGHSHWSLSDERSVSQGAFTSINLGSLWRSGFCRTRNAIKGYENWRTPGMRSRKKETIDTDRAKAMAHYPGARKCHHAALVKVFADRIVIERWSIAANERVGDDWVIPLNNGLARPYDEISRVANMPAPEFPAGAKLTVEQMTATNRGKKKVAALKLSFPAANAVKGTRPYEYQLEIIDKAGNKTYRSVLAEGVELGRESKAASGNSSIVLARATLPAGPLEFKVRPGESFGKLGNPVTAVFEG